MTSLKNDQLLKLFSLASLKMPEFVSENDVNTALVEIEKKILSINSDKTEIELLGAPSVLIVDDLELTIHQLSLLLGKSGYNVSVARTVIDAVDLFKKRHYDYVLIDLFIPNPEDGFGLLSELYSLDKSKDNQSKFIVISGTDDKKLIKDCFLKGANEFISKSSNWHIDILRYISLLEKQKKGCNEEILSCVEDESGKIVSIHIINLHKESVLLELDKEIKFWTHSGYFNIIIDLENIYTINSKGIAALIACYKIISENKGKVVLCSVKHSVNEVLSYVFLHNVLKIFANKEEAITALRSSKVK